MAKYPKVEFFYSFGDGKNLIPKTDFECDSEAIRAAEGQEKQLFKHRFVNGQRTLKEKLYDPFGND